MSVFDIVVLIPIAYASFKGFQNGIVKEILSILGLIAAVFLCFHYMDVADEFLKPYLKDADTVRPIFAALLIFIVTLTAFQFGAMLITKTLKMVMLNMPNRLLGLSFGMLKSALFVSSLLIFFAGFKIPNEDTIKESLTYPILIQVAPVTYDTIAVLYPGAENFTDTMKKTFDKNNPIKNIPVFDK